MLFSSGLAYILALTLRLCLSNAWVHVARNNDSRNNGFAVSRSHRPSLMVPQMQNEGQHLEPIIQKLLRNANKQLDDSVRCEALLHEDNSFCNKLYSIDFKNGGTPLIAKIFSPLALQRMSSVEACMLLHRVAGRRSLGPKIISVYQDGETMAILMEKCHGRTLKEVDLHSEDVSKSERTRCTLEAIAKALAELHFLNQTEAVETTTEQNMLFKTCDVMLSLCNDEWNVDNWDVNRLRLSLEDQRDEIELFLNNKDVTLSGHGDFKPSNVVLDVASKGNEMTCTAQFIDLELVGSHYRSYDLAKLFRCELPTSFSKMNRRFFIEKYTNAFNTLNSEGRRVVLLDPDVLEFKADLLIPMAWLEAAIFFACMSCHSSPKYTQKWNDLAIARLNCFEKSVNLG